MEYPPCPRHAQDDGCEKSDPTFLAESADVYTFGCKTCHLVYAYSRKNLKESVAYDTKLKRKIELEQSYKQFTSRPKHFI